MVRAHTILEVKKLSLSYGFFTGVLVLCVLIGYALYTGKTHVEERQYLIERMSLENQEFYAELQSRAHDMQQGLYEPSAWWQDPTNVVVVSAIRGAGRYVFLEPEPLGPVARGMSDILPWHGQVTLLDKEPMVGQSLANATLKRVGHIDLSFVIVFIVPLFVIALAYNSLSSERELGTYPLLASLPVSLSWLLALRLGIQAVALIMVLAAIIWGTSLATGLPIHSREGMVLLAWISAYVLFWFVLAWGVNMLHTSSATNAVTLVGLWVVFMLIMPVLINTLATTIHPVPSRSVWITAQRAFEQEANTRRASLVESYTIEHPEEIAPSELPAHMRTWSERLILQRFIDEQLQVIEHRFEESLRRQEQLMRYLRILSPPLLLQNRLEQLAGTDSRSLRGLEERLHQAHEEWRSFFLPFLQQQQSLTPEDLERVPL